MLHWFAVSRCDPHNHSQDESAVGRGLLLKKLQSKIASDPTEPIRRVYDKATIEVSDDEFVPDFVSIRTRAQRARAQYMPPIPSVITDVVVRDDWRLTWKKTKFLQKLDNNWGIAVFSTKVMLKVLNEVTCLFIDGTFRTAPRPYVQMVTILADYHGFVTPLAFCLLDGKTVGHYRQILQAIKRCVSRVTGHQLQPKKVICDFEKGLMLAVETEFPLTRIRGCYFHFTQSLWRHIQELGLAGSYRQHEQLRRFVRRVMAIAFLPLLLVRQNFLILRRSRSFVSLQQQFPSLDDWMEYIQLTYIQANSLFPPPIWNVFGRDISTRTNNAAEGTTSDKSVMPRYTIVLYRANKPLTLHVCT